MDGAVYALTEELETVEAERYQLREQVEVLRKERNRWYNEASEDARQIVREKDTEVDHEEPKCVE